MKKITLRTKVEATLVLLLLVSTVAASVVSLTRTISDSHDDVDTYIRNSNGNYWEPTSANIQLAINDLGSTGGTVWVGSDITLLSAINMEDNVQLDFQNNRVTLSGDIEFLYFSDCSWASVRNAYVIPSTYHTKSIIFMYVEPGAAWNDYCRYNVIENINIRETSSYTRQHNWTAIHLKADGDSDISMNRFDDIIIWGCHDGIILESNDNGAYINGNYFDNVFIERFVNGVWFDDCDGNSFNDNVFTHVKMQAIYLGGPGSQHPQFEWTGYDEPCYGFRNISGSSNQFDYCLVWDWMFPEDPQHTWWIGPDAEFTRINTHASAKWSYEYILDEGLFTTLEMGGYDIERFFVQDLPPSGQPNNTSWFWIDSNDNDRAYLVFNWNGNRYKAELTEI